NWGSGNGVDWNFCVQGTDQFPETALYFYIDCINYRTESGFKLIIELFRLPKYFIKILNLIVNDSYSLVFQQLLHQSRRSEMMLSGEQSVSVDYAVCRNI